MEPSLVIVAYRCEVDGEPSNSIDIQVRYFAQGTDVEIEERLRTEAVHSYESATGEPVRWPFVGVLANEPFDPPEDGSELVEFITDYNELRKWTRQSRPRDPVAWRPIVAVDAGGREFPVYIEIGTPYRIADSEWACPVALYGLHSKLKDQHGSDSFQALMLAQKLAKQLLGYFVEDGGRLLVDSGGAEIDLERLFTSGT